MNNNCDHVNCNDINCNKNKNNNIKKCLLCKYNAKENGYCGKHQIDAWKADVEKDGTKKVCKWYNRKCRNN